MATITTRPALLASAGGSFPSKIAYTATSASAFEQVSLKDEANATFLVAYFYVFSGVCVIELSQLLSAFLKQKLTFETESFVDADFAKVYYITGSGFTEVATPRIAIASKVSLELNDLSDYVIGSSLKKFFSAFQIIPQFGDCFLAIYNNSSKVVYLNEIEYENETIINTNMRILDLGKGLMRIFIAIALLSNCTKKTVQIFDAKQALANYHFKNGLSNWTISTFGSGISVVSAGGTYAQIGGVSLIPSTSASFVQASAYTAGNYRFEARYKPTLSLAFNQVVVTLPNGSVNNLEITGQSWEIVHINFTILSAGTYDLSMLFGINQEDSYSILLDYASITKVPLASSEIKEFEQRRECTQTETLAWISAIGGWEHYSFGFSNYSKTKKGSSEFIKYGDRFETVSQTECRELLQLQAVVPKSDLAGLSTLLESSEVYLVKESALVYCKVESSSIQLGNSQDELYEVSINLQLPYLNT